MYSLVIVGSESLLSLLAEVAESDSGVELTAPSSVDTAGDSMRFPIDPGTAIEALKVVAAAVGTVNGVRSLVRAWKERGSTSGDRAEGDEGRPSAGTAHDWIVISDPGLGVKLYEGPLGDLDPSELADRLEAERASGEGR